MEYDILSANGRLAKGWKLVSAPFVVNGTIYQAMIYRSLFNSLKDVLNF